MTVVWILLGLVALIVALGLLGIYGMYVAYTNDDEFQVERLEKKHGLRRDIACLLLLPALLVILGCWLASFMIPDTKPGHSWSTTG